MWINWDIYYKLLMNITFLIFWLLILFSIIKVLNKDKEKKQNIFFIIIQMILASLFILFIINRIFNIKSDYDFNKMVDYKNKFISELNLSEEIKDNIKLDINLKEISGEDKEILFNKNYVNWNFVFENIFNDKYIFGYYSFIEEDINKKWGELEYQNFVLKECLHTENLIMTLKYNKEIRELVQKNISLIWETNFNKKLENLKGLKQYYCLSIYWLNTYWYILYKFEWENF